MITATRTRDRATATDPGDDLTRPSLRTLIGLRHEGERLSLRPTKARSSLAGAHRSAFKGRGLEFSESRPYTPGDDVRALDWKVIARTGKPHTKLYQEERERSVLFWVDMRRPMWFGTRGAFKSVVAARTATLLAWSAARQGDRIGGLVFSENEHHELKPRRGEHAVLTLIRGLCSIAEPKGPPASIDTRTEAASSALARLRRVAHPGSLVVLCSDGRDFCSRCDAHLGRLAQHCDLLLVFVHDPLERALPSNGLFRFSDGRQVALVDTENDAARLGYRNAFDARVETLNGLCERHRVCPLPMGTSQDTCSALRKGLRMQAP